MCDCFGMPDRAARNNCQTYQDGLSNVQHGCHTSIGYLSRNSALGGYPNSLHEKAGASQDGFVFSEVGLWL